MKFKEFGGIVFPGTETHLIDWMKKVNCVVDGRQTYQYHKLTEALKYVKNWRHCIDVGAHIGLFSMHLAKRFHWTHCFEPVPLHRECWQRNVREKGALMFPYALGEKPGKCSMYNGTEGSCGDTWVEEGSKVEIRTIDSFRFVNLDFLKIDCEGYEYFVLKGAEETLKKWKPAIMVEQKPGHAQRFGLGELAAVEYLESLGAKRRGGIQGDYFFSWD
jgi:FkbM family methyltransferase